MKRLSLLIALVATFAFSSVALADPGRGNTYAPGQNKVICGAGGDASATQKGAKGCELSVGDGGGAAFAYLAPASAWDQNLSAVTALSFSYSGDEPTGGSPRFSLQIDEDGAGGPEVPYAFVGAMGCNDGSGKVDVINDETCLVEYDGTTYDNWAAFAAAFPDATLYFAFVIVDQPGTYIINNVTIGKVGGKK